MEAGNNRPPFQEHGDLELYRGFYNSAFSKPIVTHDGISVYFRRNRFGHAIQESSQKDGNKDTFSIERAKRLGWIKIALQDLNLELKAGWNKKDKCYDHTGRVTLMIDDFVVVIRLISSVKAEFVTCYVADSPRTKRLILSSPTWINPYR